MRSPQVATDSFVQVTELVGQSMSMEQLNRLCHRYHWAATFCAGKDVIELACGGGQGLGLLASRASRLYGADISPEVLQQAVVTYGDDIPLAVFSADDVPFPAQSFDVVLLYEALYYLPDARAFAREAHRLLRPGGKLLVVNANKDLYDFTRSPFSTTYHGVVELDRLLGSEGFNCAFAGYVDIREVSWRQKLFRPIKLLASKLDLIPKTMRGKSFLKNIIFGKMIPMPSRIDDIPFSYHPPTPIEAGQPNHCFKVIYCNAIKV